MTEPLLREIAPEDVPALKSLWARCFGDEARVIEAFFRLLPDMGGGVAAVVDGEIAGAAYILTGQELLVPGKLPQLCGYLYGVAVEAAYRGHGLGRALSRAAAELGGSRGAELLCTLPAERSLYGWYEEILGLSRALDRRASRVKAAPGPPCMELSAAEYQLRRESLLRGTAHARLSVHSLEFQRQLCAGYGGGFFSCGDAVAAVYREGRTALARELLCPAGVRREPIAAALAARLGAEEALLYTPARPGEGEPYLAARPGKVPGDCVWNLTFD